MRRSWHERGAALMSDYPPKGDEKRALSVIAGICARIDKLAGELEDCGWGLKADGWDNDVDWTLFPKSALEGVRTNGVERTSTLANFLLTCDAARERKAEIIRVSSGFCELLDKMVEICEMFDLCPVCKGNCGVLDLEPGCGREWEDCEHCAGRGVLVTERVQEMREP